MPRPKRADEKNAIYHALNLGNGRSTIFLKEGDYWPADKQWTLSVKKAILRVVLQDVRPHRKFSFRI